MKCHASEFKLKLLSRALEYHPSLQNWCEQVDPLNCSNNFGQISSFVRGGQVSIASDLLKRNHLDLTVLKRIAEEKEKNSFVELFLTNKLCFMIQNIVLKH